MKRIVHSVTVFILVVAAVFLLFYIYENYIEPVKKPGTITESGQEPAAEPGMETDTGNVKDYFPVLKDIKYIYETAETEVFYEVTVDYASEDKMQLRSNHSDKSNISVIQIIDEKAVLTYSQEEEYFRQNLMNYSDNGDVLLMEPIEEGTKWSLKNGGVSKITSVSSKVSTPVDMYDAIEVTTQWENKKTVDYYSKGVGLVKKIEVIQEIQESEEQISEQGIQTNQDTTVNQDSPVIIESQTSKTTQTTVYLSEIDKDYILSEEINFYFPDINNMKVLSIAETVEFRTNDFTEDVFTKSYRSIAYKGVKVFSRTSSINKIDIDPDGTLHIDLNNKFLKSLNVEALYEGMILQSITNTFGRFYEAEQLIFTVENEDYKSENIKLYHKPMKVNFVDFPMFYDVVVYGGTASGIMAAVAASREGHDVVLIETSNHLGGMVTGGLSYTDHGNIKVIGGMTREFFEMIGRRYGKEVSWFYEPHLAEEVFKEMIEEENIHVYYNLKLKEKRAVEKDGSSLVSMEMENGDLFYAQVFIDSTYEGDLMAESGVTYTVGREDNDDYSESFAGVLPSLGRNNFYYNMNAFGVEGNLFEEISINLPGPSGQGDDMVQAYNYRLCLTNNFNNQIPFAKPNNYNRNRYMLLSAWLNLIKEKESRSIKFSDVVYFGPLPSSKYDINNSGAFSTDYIGGSSEYPEADYERREEIKNEHKEYIQGLLYFIGNDESVPEELRADVKQWGYAADEFIDNDYWPYQLYVREARRMVGDFVMTENDVRKDKKKDDAIGMGSYNIDSHNVQRYLTLDGFVQNEGEIQIPVTPYQIPYRVMMPKISEADNLIVTVCVSASHIAYSSMRMEPQYMIMGEAAGIAASMSIDKDLAVQNINVVNLKERLLDKGVVIEVPIE